MNSSGQRYHVIVVSNYGPDDQPSMLRYAESLAEGLRARGHQVEQLAPRPFFIRGGGSLNGAKKWLGYLDKFLLFPFILHHKLSQARRSSLPVILHICDHSNAPYAFWSGMTPVVVTCHDVGAIKGARGLLPDCPATLLGRLLQKWIGAGLRRASRVACVSKFTAVELAELVMGGVIQTLRVVPNGFNRDFQKLNWAQSQEVIKRWPLLGSGGSYILHVGSGLRRKNREVVLKVFAQVWREDDLWLVIAGEPLNAEMWQQIKELGITSRVIEVARPSDGELEALYRCAQALLFPSRFEGFGWPIIEAQACGCPVLAADNSAQPEVLGEGGMMRNSEDVEGYATDLRRLRDPEFRQQLVEAGLQNATRFSLEKVVDSMESIYHEVLPQHLKLNT